MVCREETSAHLRELLEAAAHMDPEEYRSWALGHISALLSIESAEWILGSARCAGATQACEAHEFVHHDSPGLAGPLMQLRFRRKRTQTFSSDECSALMLLAAQACGAWRMSAQLRLLRSQPGTRGTMALADTEGRIHAVQGNFHDALRESWPQWNEGALPSRLREPMPSGERVQAGRYRWLVESAGALLRVSAEPLGAAAFLTLREQAVASAVLESGSQKAAAAKLRVSNHTVRNTLVRVYSKLGVSNRMELALRFRTVFIRQPNAAASRQYAAGA